MMGVLPDDEIVYWSTFVSSLGSRSDLRRLVSIHKYPSGEPLVQWDDIEDRVSTLLVRQRNMDAFMTAMFLVDALAERGHPVPELILPFVPGARQDRLNPRGDYLFTIKSVAGLINQRNFPLVTVVDPHSEVTPALIDRCRVVTAAECVDEVDDDGGERWSAVISPDAGAEKRAGLVAHMLGVPLVYAWKSRDVGTGALTGFGIQDIPDELKAKPLLVVDDICDGGGTFVGLAEIMPSDVEVDLFVTHGMFTKGTEALLSRYGRVLTTDTVIADRPGVQVLNICADLI